MDNMTDAERLAGCFVVVATRFPDIADALMAIPDGKKWDQTECVLAKPGRAERAAIREYNNPCERNGPAFSFLANSPRSVVHCIGFRRVYMETSWTTTYALDADGRIWRWSHQSYAYRAIQCSGALTLVGGSAGLALGIIWARRWRQRKRDQ